MPKYPIELPSGRVIMLDPKRAGDRRQLARLIAQIAWRLAREDAASFEVQTKKSIMESTAAEQHNG